MSKPLSGIRKLEAPYAVLAVSLWPLLNQSLIKAFNQKDLDEMQLSSKEPRDNGLLIIYSFDLF